MFDNQTSSFTEEFGLFQGAMVFNATFSVILWWSVLFVEETGVPGENHRPVFNNQSVYNSDSNVIEQYRLR
jgi:hypothetical protein